MPVCQCLGLILACLTSSYVNTRAWREKPDELLPHYKISRSFLPRFVVPRRRARVRICWRNRGPGSPYCLCTSGVEQVTFARNAAMRWMGEWILLIDFQETRNRAMPAATVVAYGAAADGAGRERGSERSGHRSGVCREPKQRKEKEATSAAAQRPCRLLGDH